jgi:cytochrome c biogenesis protein CcmG/thiol:disulfide interchange protein DsbE
MSVTGEARVRAGTGLLGCPFYHDGVTRPRGVVAAILAIVLGAGACGGDPATPTAEGTPAIRVVDAPLLPATVEALPDMDVAGFEELLGQLHGTPVVVNFWATWCDPCERELPLLAAAARDLADEVQFVGVDILDNRDAAGPFLTERGVPYPNVFDADGVIRTSLGSIGQPVTAFYDADGRLAAKVDGELSEEDLRAHLAEITG